MTQLPLPVPADGTSPFDAIRQMGEYGEFWSARDLMPLLGYERWERFADAITRASIASTNAGTAGDHFRGVAKVIKGGRWGTQSVQDYRLTRYGAYLVAMNGDPRKPEIATAQTYFAVKTRQAETQTVDVSQLDRRTLALMVIEAEDARIAAEMQVAELEPRAAQADHYREADGLYAIASFANDLQLWAKENHDVKILHEQVRDFLGDIGFIIRGDTIRNNEPKAEAIKAGYVRPKHVTYETNTRGRQTKTSTRLTPKGWGYAWDRAVVRIADHGSLEPTQAMEVA